MNTEYIPRLKIKYKEEVRAYLTNELNINNPMRIPKLTKIVLNLGIGDAAGMFPIDQHSLAYNTQMLADFDVISKLDDDLILYPGHDYGTANTSTIEREKKMNPVMQPISEEDFIMRMGG